MERYRRYQRRKFEYWKHKVQLQLPEIVAKFYAQNRICYEDHVLLGKVIHWVNSPFFSLVDNNGRPTDPLTETADQICLEILVCDLFKKVNTNS